MRKFASVLNYSLPARLLPIYSHFQVKDIVGAGLADILSAIVQD